MRAALILAAAVAALAACAPVPEPIVDMAGVDSVVYQRDLAECYRTQPFIAAGNPVTACMRAKGYRILYER